MFNFTSEKRNAGSKLFSLLPLLFVVMSFTTGIALAQSPHFLSTSASSGVDNTLVVSWKEAGLGNSGTVTYSASASATAVYECINGGSKNPKASNKTSVAALVSASGEFPVTKNGSITASLTLEPPSPPSTFSCPSGQTEVLASVSYSDIMLRDETNNITVDISGTFSTSKP
jgi:hypothetical protein